MGIAIPNLNATDCRLASFCCVWDSTDKEMIEWAIAHSEEIYEYKKNVDGQDLHIQVDVDGDLEDSDIHFHVNMATPALFDNDDLPVVDENPPDFEEMMAKMMGQEVRLVARGLFFLSTEQLPPIIKLTQKFRAISGDMNIVMTGGDLRISGSTIDKITWKVNDEKKRATLELRAKVQIRLEPEYMKAHFELLENAYKTFLEGQVQLAK